MEPKENKNIDLDKLAEMSGEASVRRFRYQVPVLKFNGSTGKFSLLTQDDSGKWKATPVKKEGIEVVVLKVRRVLASYEKLPDGTGLRTFTNEHNSWKDTLTVFEMRKGDTKPRMMDSGSSQDIRNKFPELRLRQSIYCLYKNDVVKLLVRGKSLSALFDYYKEFEAKEHIFQFVSQLDIHSETNEGGLEYYVMDWKKGPKSDINVVAKNIQEVKTALDLQDKQYAEMSDGKPEEEVKVEKDVPEIDPDAPEDTDVPKEKNEEVRSEDIPF